MVKPPEAITVGRATPGVGEGVIVSKTGAAVGPTVTTILWAGLAQPPRAIARMINAMISIAGVFLMTGLT
jgi:hypothetical protein